MDKPAKRLTREKQFRVRVPIGAIFTRHILFSCLFSWLFIVFLVTSCHSVTRELRTIGTFPISALRPFCTVSFCTVAFLHSVTRPYIIDLCVSSANGPLFSCRPLAEYTKRVELWCHSRAADASDSAPRIIAAEYSSDNTTTALRVFRLEKNDATDVEI